MDRFWEQWAILHATEQWCVYRWGTPVPEVDRVERDDDLARWLVYFVGGSVFEVRLYGIARPHIAHPVPTPDGVS
jgi:hypothetical protein